MSMCTTLTSNSYHSKYVWFIHTYIYIIGHYNSSIRIIDLVSHTTYVVCINFIHKLRDLQFKVDSERQIFWETFNGNFIYSQSFCQKSVEKKLPKKYFRFSFWYLACNSNPGFSSNKPTHCLLDHDDFLRFITLSFRFITLEKTTYNTYKWFEWLVTVLVIVAFTKNENRHISKKTERAASRANTQPSSEYFNVRTRFIFILCFVDMLCQGESNSRTSNMLLSMNMMSTSNFEYE